MSIVTLNDRAVRSVSAFGSVSGGSMVFIKKLTASSSSTLSFVNGSSDVVLDSTYKEYLFTYNSMHPASDSANFTVGFRDGDTDYDATKTTTIFRAYHQENGGASALGYYTGGDIVQGTGFQILNYEVDNDADSCCSGHLHLFNPSSTTFVKHFIARSNSVQNSDISRADHVAGYCNVTAAIDAVQFKFSSGNIDAGDICLYGIL
jgi:hypothetical protein|tara:strand:+ start:1942 stop:2556 length:615 start_codon:yes stop_codon:yes gene_type:complete